LINFQAAFLKRYPQLEKGTGSVPAKAVNLQNEGANRYMDIGNKVSGFAYTAVNSNKLSPTQQMVLDAVTSLGLNVDTAAMFSTKSNPAAPRQCTYDMPKT
jgi:hypothetical protein